MLCTIARTAESFELLHDEIVRRSRSWGFIGGSSPPRPLKLRRDHFSPHQVVPFVELNLLGYCMTKSIEGVDFSVFGDFRARAVPLPAPTKLRWDHFLPNHVVPFVELNLLSYCMTKSIEGVKFSVFGGFRGRFTPRPLKIGGGEFSRTIVLFPLLS